MLSEMFSSSRMGQAAATNGILDSQNLWNYRWPPYRIQPPATGDGGGGVSDDEKQLNPEAADCVTIASNYNNLHHQYNQVLSINSSQLKASTSTTSSSNLHSLVSDQSNSHHFRGFHQSPAEESAVHQFTWIPGSSSYDQVGGVLMAEDGTTNQGLSLSLSSSLRPLGGVKFEELRMGNGEILFPPNQGLGVSNFLDINPCGSSNLRSFNHHQNQNPSLHSEDGRERERHHHGQLLVGFGASLEMVNVMRNSKYGKAAKELLEELCCTSTVGKCNQGGLKKQTVNPNSSEKGDQSDSAAVGSSSSSKEHPTLSAAEKSEFQRRKVKLLSMLDEVDERYRNYREKMQAMVNSFNSVMGYGAATTYTALAQKAMSEHFRCVRNSVAAQLRATCKMLGEKDVGGAFGLTKGETPRLKILDQSLRQHRAFHQMGMMMGELEAWRPQRGLPERSVNILRAWLFEHFLNPYPSDADKQLLCRQTGLSKNQVSNWFINARVRLWKPMVEEMYQQDAKEEETPTAETEPEAEHSDQTATTLTTQPFEPSPNGIIVSAPKSMLRPTPMPSPTRKFRPGINAPDGDPLGGDPNIHSSRTHLMALQGAIAVPANSSAVAPAPASAPAPAPAPASAYPWLEADDRFWQGNVAANSAQTSHVVLGRMNGDVSLTLGLRHSGNAPESQIPARDFRAF